MDQDNYGFDVSLKARLMTKIVKLDEKIIFIFLTEQKITERHASKMNPRFYIAMRIYCSIFE